MSTKLSRREYKIVINDFNVYKFLNVINKEFDQLYMDRFIKSLYFDTLGFKLYKESLFQDSDRFKIRFRNYPRSNEKIYKEIKFNTAEGKKKTVEEVSFKKFSHIKEYFFQGIEYYPASFVQYKRSYFANENIRLTIDKDVMYQSHRFRGINNKIYSRKTIIEYKLLKSNQSNLFSKIFYDKNDSIEDKIIKNPEKFSKYVDSVSNLYNVKINWIRITKIILKQYSNFYGRFTSSK